MRNLATKKYLHFEKILKKFIWIKREKNSFQKKKVFLLFINFFANFSITFGIIMMRN